MAGKITCLALFLSFSALAQNNELNAPPYPKDYFRNPLDIPVFLAGNFGECRPGHFHSGTDIKTKGEENQPVHAAADGYISRIKMEKGGFGHGLYITHPNGYTTLYAHLNDFAPEIQKYVKEKQYEQKRWDVDLQLPPSKFPVKKGQQVAWSGNTGASTAPHLHFEIRDTKTEHPLNPELFGLPLVDHIAPVPAEIAIYTGPIYEDVSGSPAIFAVKKIGNNYRPVNTADTIIVSSRLAGIGVNVDDYMEGSDNTLAIYNTKLYMDDILQGEVVLDDIGYDVSRYINAYADYKIRKQKGRWMQCLFQLPGNRLDVIYKHLNANKGKLSLADDKAHKVTIQLIDDKGNESNIVFYLKGGNEQPAKPKENTTPLYANKSNKVGDKEFSFILNEKQLYDDINFYLDEKTDMNKYSSVFQLHYPYVPVHEYFELMIKPNQKVPADQANKIVLMYSDGKQTEGSAAQRAPIGWYKTKVREFGTYWLDVDTIPPVIKSLQKNGANLSYAKQITFEVKDQTTSVKEFSGYLDGNWICFEQHGSSFFYKFDEHCKKGKHQLVFKAADESDNMQTYKLTFTR